MNLVQYDNFNLYINEVNKIPFLTPEEEFQYAVDYFENKNYDSAKKIVQSNLKFVVKVAQGYTGYDMPTLDLIQEGNIGLLTAVRKFDPYRNTGFRTYAAWWIESYIKKYVMDNWSMFKMSTDDKARKYFFNTNKKLESIQDATFIKEVKTRMKQELSLHTEDEFGEEIINHLKCDLPNPEALMIEYQNQSNIKDAVQVAISKLNERDQYIIEHRIMDNTKERKEVATELGISTERVRQLEERIMRRLRNELTECNLNVGECNNG
jgi:RNA polymerase sigma-32 factor